MVYTIRSVLLIVLMYVNSVYVCVTERIECNAPVCPYHYTEFIHEYV